MLWLQQEEMGTVPSTSNNCSGERLQCQVQHNQKFHFGGLNGNHLKLNLVRKPRTKYLNVKEFICADRLFN